LKIATSGFIDAIVALRKGARAKHFLQMERFLLGLFFVFGDGPSSKL